MYSLKTYTRNEESSQTNNQEIEKEVKNKPESIRRKQIIKSREEINEIMKFKQENNRENE